jgi:YcxB-like protein
VFGETGIDISSSSSHGHTTYEGFFRFIEGKDTLLLFIAGGEVAILVPKRWCAQEELSALVDGLRRRIAPRPGPTRRLGLGKGLLLWVGTVLICLGLWHLLGM